MRAIILAAGRGLRLQQPDKEDFPKVLLNFAGQTLLERHLRLLQGAGIGGSGGLASCGDWLVFTDMGEGLVVRARK